MVFMCSYISTSRVESDARNGGGLYDAYYTNPLALGTAVSLGGLLDLTKYVKESKYSEWVRVVDVIFDIHCAHSTIVLLITYVSKCNHRQTFYLPCALM